MTAYDGSSSHEIVACQRRSLKVCLKMKGFINQVNSFRKLDGSYCVTVSQQIDWSYCPCMSIIPMLSMDKSVDFSSASFNHLLLHMYS